jgi:hypothetical protein
MGATLNDVCEALAPACRAAGYEPVSAQELLEFVAQDEELRVAALNRGLRQCGGRPERTLLRDEKGRAFGEVLMEIPLGLWENLTHSKRWGPEALNTPEGRKEVLKAFPECGVKTVRKTRVSGFNFRGANFGGLEFAK